MIITYMRLLIFSKKNEVLALQLNESGLEFMIVTAIRQKHHHASVQNDIKSANCEYVCAYMYEALSVVMFLLSHLSFVLSF